jgi:hypothetical protein
VQKFVSKYATAAHLALLAVAPLFLLPFLSPDKLATVMLWLSAVAGVWVLMEPSRRRNELPHDARCRVTFAIFLDPFFWFLLFALAYAAVRAMNTGIAPVYNAEDLSWSLSAAALPILPGSVAGSGYLPFAALVSLLVLTMGARHALGRAARLAFFAAATVLTGLSAAIGAFAMSYGHQGVLALAACDYASPSFHGAAYGIALLGGVVALFGSAERKWRQVEPLVGLGLISCSIGLLVYAPPAMIAVFAVAFLIQVIASFALQSRVLEGSGSFRCALGILCVILTAGAFLVFSSPETVIGVKRLSLFSLAVFPESFMEMREVLSRIALTVWKSGPWLGSGLGSFGYDIRFHAAGADWSVLNVAQQAVPSAWWMLIAERGVVGASLFAVGLGFLLWTFCSRLVFAIGKFRWQPMNLLLIVLLPAFVAISFVDCSFVRADVLPLLAVCLALSASAFPARQVRGPAE